MRAPIRRRRSPLGAALFFALLASPLGAGAAEDGPENYPEGPNREETYYFCAACHSFRIVSRQGMNRDRWDDTLSWMSERHNMPVLEGADRQAILNYLAHAYPENAPSGRAGWKNPFAPP